MIIPCIDLLDGKAVQLKQGKEKILEVEDVFGIAGRFSCAGDLAIVDLNAAFGKGNNDLLVEQLCASYDCRVGGGIRTSQKAEQVLSWGAKKIVIGTAASKDFLSALPRKKTIVAIDSSRGKVVANAWRESTGVPTIDFALDLQDYCSGFLYTGVDVEGMMGGFDLDFAKSLRELLDGELVVAGGISEIEQVSNLDAAGIDCQVGMAVYSGKLSIEDCFASCVNFEKRGGLVPTVVLDPDGRVLSLLYSNYASLKEALKTGDGIYFSNSRQKTWRKGETSGNTQTLLRAYSDCDRDALVFVVEQKNGACHTGEYSCFNNYGFSLQDLEKTIAERISVPSPKSYTSLVSTTPALLEEKIMEEAQEVIDFTDQTNLKREVADLTYFLTIKLAKNGLKWDDVFKELQARSK
ncbi:TPA: phosphoribosyl-ATP diphosphatase [Candidatus Micrarchaeota archaeon]|nr:phosphoribosyl-ATP diphosphatase [Candidatus Micrarchaeota archaeon]